MINADFNCRHCESFEADGRTDGHEEQSWTCLKYQRRIDHRDAGRCVCRRWRPGTGLFPAEVRDYFLEVAPGALNHLRSSELYRTAPECELLQLS